MNHKCDTDITNGHSHYPTLPIQDNLNDPICTSLRRHHIHNREPLIRAFQQCLPILPRALPRIQGTYHLQIHRGVQLENTHRHLADLRHHAIHDQDAAGLAVLKRHHNVDDMAENDKNLISDSR